MLDKTADKAELLSVGDVTGLLGISRTSVQKMVDTGLLRAMRTIGGHRRILRSSVLAVLGAQPMLHTGPGALYTLAEKPPALTVLIVEDNATTTLSYRKAIKRSQFAFHCEFATDGMEALLKIERLRPDVLVTDLQMEPFDGFRLISAVQRDAQLAQIGQVVVTGLDDEEIERRGGVPPGVLLYKKPVPWDRLIGYLEAHAQGRMQRVEQAAQARSVPAMVKDGVA